MFERGVGNPHKAGFKSKSGKYGYGGPIKGSGRAPYGSMRPDYTKKGSRRMGGAAKGSGNSHKGTSY